MRNEVYQSFINKNEIGRGPQWEWEIPLWARDWLHARNAVDSQEEVEPYQAIYSWIFLGIAVVLSVLAVLGKI